MQVDPKHVIVDRFRSLCEQPSDINEHLPTLYNLARKTRSAAEFGVRGVVSTYALMLGLGQSSVAKSDERRKLICVDIEDINVDEVRILGDCVGVDVEFICHDSATVDIPEVDLLWIDTWHIYEHLKRELEAHHKKAKKYIAMHDTEVDGIYGESIRLGLDVEQQSKDTGYPVDGICKGLKPAIEEFLEAHGDEWQLLHHYINNNGMTILERISPVDPVDCDENAAAADEEDAVATAATVAAVAAVVEIVEGLEQESDEAAVSAESAESDEAVDIA